MVGLREWLAKGAWQEGTLTSTRVNVHWARAKVCERAQANTLNVLRARTKVCDRILLLWCS